jgi:hypothetical protein
MGIEREAWQPVNMLALVLLCVSSVIMGTDFVVMSLSPLRSLGISVPPIFEYMHFLASAVALVVCIVLGRRWPKASALAVFVLCYVLIGSVAIWSDHQVERVKITKFIDSNDLLSLESRMGFKVFERGDGTGVELWVEKGNERLTQLISETKRLGIYRP